MLDLPLQNEGCRQEAPMHRIILPRALAFFAVLLATTLAASTADAGKVIVLAVAGDRDGNFEDGLSSIVQDRHDIVTSGQAERVARRSGLKDLDGPSLGKLARKLGADAVVEGSVSHEDEGYMFVVRIRGKNGKTVKKITVDLRKPKLTKKAKKRLGMGVLDGIDTVLGVADEDDDVDGDAAVAAESPRKSKKDKKGDKAEKSEKAEKKERKKAFRDSEPEEVAAPAADESNRADDSADDDGDRERVAAADDTAAEADVGVERDAPGRRPARVRPAAIITVGPSAKARNLAFTSRAFDQAPYGYKSSLVPGVRVAAEVYPLAFSGDGGPVAGLGVAFDYDQTIGMTTRSSDAPDVDLATVQKHWDAGVRYRIAFGQAATAPTATVGVDYGQRVFQIQRAGLPAGAELDMPDVDYKYIAPGVDLRYPLGMKLAVHGGGRALLITSAGAIQQPDSYGGAKMTGFEAGAGMQYGITSALMVGVDGSLTQIGYEFLGNGTETFGRDSDPATQDVDGASDRYIGVVAAVGYTY